MAGGLPDYGRPGMRRSRVALTMAELGRTARIGRALIESKEIAMTVLEPASQAFADAAAQPPFMFQLPLATGRAKLVELQSAGVDKPDVEAADLVVASPSGHVPVRVVRP